MEIKNKTAIVTGSGKGIGKQTAITLLENGVNVAGWSFSKNEIEHPNYKFIKTDIRDYESVKNAFLETTAHFGPDIHILINNAGVGFESVFEELEIEKWHKMFETNVNGIFYTTKLIVPIMKKIGEGHIVNISSVAGLTGIERMSAYCATKHAVRGLSQALYKEVRNDGIKVTCIYPGSVKTNFFDEIESVTIHDNMMRPEDIASTILHALQSHPNYHHVDIEVRPLRVKSKKK